MIKTGRRKKNMMQTGARVLINGQQYVVTAKRVQNDEGKWGRWITSRGTNVFVEDGQSEADAIKKKFGESSSTANRLTTEESTQFISKMKKTLDVVPKGEKPYGKLFLLPDGKFYKVPERGEHRGVVSNIFGDMGFSLEKESTFDLRDALRLGIQRVGFDQSVAMINGILPLNSKQKDAMELAMIRNGMTSDNLLLEFEDEEYEKRLPRMIKASTITASDRVQDENGNWGKWITIRGTAVFVRDGEGPAEAFKRTTGKSLYSHEKQNDQSKTLSYLKPYPAMFGKRGWNDVEPNITKDQHQTALNLLEKIITLDNDDAVLRKGYEDMNRREEGFKALYYARENIQFLIAGRRLKKDWQWVNPFPTTHGNETTWGDGQNNGFVEDLLKGKVAITLVTPEEYERLANTYRQGKDRQASSKDTIEKLAKRISDGGQMDSVYVVMNSDLTRMVTQEGAHRAAAARRAGVRFMPMYVYKHGGAFTDEQLKRLSDNNFKDIDPLKDFSRTGKVVTAKITELDMWKGRSGRFIKGFLLNDKRNKNGWRVTWDAIKTHYADFIGKPGTYYLRGGEPDHPEGMSYKLMMTNQENYRVANIIDVELDEENRTLNYVAEVLPDELTDLTFNQVLDENGIDHTSPGIFPTSWKKIGGTMPNGQEKMDVYAFRALHIAYIDNPAYGKAATHTIGQCEGLGETCMRQLTANTELEPLQEIPLIRKKLAKLFTPCQMKSAVEAALKLGNGVSDRLRAITADSPNMEPDLKLAIAYAYSQDEGRVKLTEDIENSRKMRITNT